MFWKVIEPAMRRTRCHSRERGFTLVEAIMVMVITGAIAASVSVFIAGPVRGYVDAARRAQLTDGADVALRRMVRDLRGALPNSVRVTASGADCFMELIPTVGGGRYRAEVDAAGAGVPLTLTATAGNTTFDVLGPAVPPFAAGTSIVVYNLNGATLSGPNAYMGDNRRAYVAHITAALPAGTAARVTVGAGAALLDSPGRRFSVVGTPVTYQWSAAGHSIIRRSGYGFVAAQPAAFAGTGDLVAGNVGNAVCPFTYDPAVVAERAGLVTIALTLTDASGESVFLHRQAHVDNAP
jgi:MSHA biogenesis protein MshO